MAKDMYQKRKERKEKKIENQDNEINKNAINWYPGHMAKTKRQIIEDLKLIDIVVEVLDARVVVSSQNPDVKEYCTNKQKIVILNKSDLADENVTNMWIEYYKKRGVPAIKVEASNGKGLQEVVKQIKTYYKEVEQKYIEKGRIGRTAKVMVLGIPNVGKSTFINSIAKRSAAQVGNRPGVTTKKQWIKIGTEIELMDTPGMLWPRLNDTGVAMHLAFVNTIGQNALDNEEVAYFLLQYLIKNYKQRVCERYEIDIPEDEEIIETRDKIAIKKGCILSGGRINEQKISDMIINDFQTGKLGRVSIERP